MPKPVKIAAVALTAIWMLCCAAALCRAQSPQETACRVTVDDRDGATSHGSGTLVDVCEDGSVGLVVTNAHVVRDRRSDQCLIVFADGRRHGARLVALDATLDLAALVIAKPGRRAAVCTAELQGETFRGVGFGPAPANRWQSMPGQVIADYASGAQHSISLNRSFREGDSGGGLFDQQDRLCGVIWGSTGDEGFCVHPAQVAAFIAKSGGRVVQPQQYVQQPPCYIDATGRRICPLQPRAVARPVTAIPPVTSASIPPVTSPAVSCNCQTTIAALTARVNELEARQPAQGPPGERGPQGEQGPRGTDGEDGKDAVFDVEAVAAAMRAALPPIHVVQRDYHSGAVVSEKDVALGETLTLRFGAKEQPVDVVRPQP